MYESVQQECEDVYCFPIWHEIRLNQRNVASNTKIEQGVLCKYRLSCAKTNSVWQWAYVARSLQKKWESEIYSQESKMNGDNGESNGQFSDIDIVSFSRFIKADKNGINVRNVCAEFEHSYQTKVYQALRERCHETIDNEFSRGSLNDLQGFVEKRTAILK